MMVSVRGRAVPGSASAGALAFNHEACLQVSHLTGSAQARFIILLRAMHIAADQHGSSTASMR
jgi:hypothetical protein